MKSAAINISLPPEEAARIRRECQMMDKSLSKFFREAAELYLTELGKGRGFAFDPAVITKARDHMKAIERYANELQEVLKNIKEQCTEN